MERHLDAQLDKLKTRLIKMCSLVDEQVDFALRALEEENEELAKLVIERDNKVDKHDIKIDKICQKIFALNQPVAMDLRLIMSALTINNNLERIGDIAVNIASSYLILKKKPEFLKDTLYHEMAKVVREMLKNSIDAFISFDASLAQKVINQDDELDEYNSRNHRIIIDIMKKDMQNIEPGVALIVIGRQLERLGDHTTNICEDVYFIVEAQLIKHKYEKILDQELKNEEEDEE